MDSLTPGQMIEKIGSFGRYQIRLLMIMGFMKIFGDGFQAMIAIFLAAEPPWKCATNSSSCNITWNILPGHEFYNLRCRLLRSEWEFDTSEFSSIVSEWDLVCDRSSLSSLSKGVLFAGYLTGVLFGGVLSDKFGRKRIVYFPSVLCTVLALIASFVNAFWIFALLRGLIGVCTGSASMCTFILLVEYVGIKHRAVMATCLNCFWSFGVMLLALWGYLFRDWRTLSIAGSVPGLLVIFPWWFLPESPRWLVVRNKTNQATEMLTKVAQFNRKEMPANPVVIMEEKQRLGDVRDLFRSWKMSRITLTSWFGWVVVTMVYFGATFSAGSFGGNIYLEFFLIGLVEIPSHFAALGLMNKKGRKVTISLGLAVSSIASVGAVLLQRDASQTGYFVGRIIMTLLAKFFISISFDVVYVFTAELFPTVIRSVAIGTSSAAGRIGAIAAPFIVWLVRIHVLLPYSIFAITAFIAGVLCLTLPETTHQPFKETFETKPPKVEKSCDGGSEKLLEAST